MWKGIAIFGIWGSIAAVAFAGGDINTIGVVSLCGMVGTFFVAIA